MDVSAINEADMTALTAQGYTKDDLQFLAETEVKALLAPDSTDDDGVDKHAAAAAAQEAAAAEAAAAAAAAAAKPAATPPATTPPANEPPAEEDEPAPRDTFVPQYTAEVPADAKAKIDELQKEEKAAFKRLMDGEIEAEAYQEIKDRVGNEVDALKTAALTAHIFSQANVQAQEQAARNEWNKAEVSAMNSFKDEGIDYRAKPALLAAYNTHLKSLGADPKNERRDAAWFLTEAHKLTKADLGITTATPTPAARKDVRAVDPAEIPPTLRGVPAAATGAVNSDEFAHMRNLDGLALEKAVAGMNDAQRERWLSE
jgi:hypothetical protein